MMGIGLVECDSRMGNPVMGRVSILTLSRLWAKIQPWLTLYSNSAWRSTW